MDIQRLKLGSPAAERDSDLFKCFIANDSYARIKSGDRTIILGNRGTGKSAIFRKLAEDESKNNKIIIKLAPEDYSYEMMSSVLEKESKGAWAKHGAYTVAWKYLIYIECLKAIAQTGSLKLGKSAKIYEFVRDNVKDFETNPIGILIAYIKRLEGLKVGKYDFSIKTAELERLYKLDELKPFIEILDEIAEKRPIIVMVDELDNGWDASEDAKAFVSGLFAASISFKTKHKNIRVLLSLRKELYNNIPEIYEDAQKISDAIEHISWNEDQLLELISRRIANCYPELENKIPRSQWNSVFSEVLSYRKANSFNYMIDRTQFRPREIIEFCNKTADYARDFEKELPLDYEIIAKAEGIFSESRMHDIASEYKFQYPGLNDLFETFRGKKFNMSKDEFHDHLFSVATGEFTLSAEADWIKNSEPDQLIKILWEVGFIKAQVVGGVKAQRRSGSEWMGSYQIAGINILGIPSYQVHPMFRLFLGMKEKKEK